MTPQSDSLVFRFLAKPPRKTHQGGVQYRSDPRVKGGVRVFLSAAHCNEAWEMRAEFSRQLPEGWTPREDPAKVAVTLVYPQRKTDRLPGGAYLPHTERPDADNLVKSILDAMTRARVWVDDAQVFDLRVRKWRGAVPLWEVRVDFGGQGYLDGQPMPLADLKRRLAEQRRAARRKPVPDDNQPTLNLETEGD